jgi:hypothetical protein
MLKIKNALSTHNKMMKHPKPRMECQPAYVPTVGTMFFKNKLNAPVQINIRVYPPPEESIQPRMKVGERVEANYTMIARPKRHPHVQV